MHWIWSHTVQQELIICTLFCSLIFCKDAAYKFIPLNVVQFIYVICKEQILLLNGDDFTVAPLTVLRNVEKFIGVPEFFKENHFNFTGIYRFIHILKNYVHDHSISSGRKGYPCFTLVTNGCADENKARKHPELHQETLTKLRNHFTPMLKKFERQTGMKLELSWNKGSQAPTEHGS